MGLAFDNLAKIACREQILASVCSHGPSHFQSGTELGDFQERVNNLERPDLFGDNAQGVDHDPCSTPSATPPVPITVLVQDFSCFYFSNLYCRLSWRAPQAAAAAERGQSRAPIGKLFPRARSGVRSALSGNWGLWGMGDQGVRGGGSHLIKGR